MHAELSSGVSLYYERSGSGDPLVLIAGTGCDHNYWRLQEAEYAKEREVILLDTRGAGQSTVAPDPDSYTAEVLADDIAELISQLGYDRVDVAGHSLGSCIAQQLALRHADMLRSVQLHATWAHADTWLQRAFIGTTEYPLALGDLQMTFKTVSMWMLSPEYLETWQPPVVADMVSRCLIRNEHLQANEGMLGHLHADTVHDTRDQLGSITVPTLVTAGAADMLIPARYGRQVADLVPGAQYHEFPGPRSSHAYNWELVDEFNEVTSKFLRSL
jgi:pimeloyl-ACP methyl ester carboxylesterase